MAMSPNLILGYLHHAQAIAAQEQLDAAEVQALPYLKRNDQRRAVERLERAAAGLTRTPAEERAQKQAAWDAGWDRLRGVLGGPTAAPAGGGGLAPGERVVIPPG
jgi:hypothetical protein